MKTHWILETCLATIFLAWSPAARADAVWNAGTSDWFTAANWTPQTVPTASDNVYINNDVGTARIGSTGAVGNIVFVGEGTGSGALIIQNGGTLDAPAVSVSSANSGSSINGEVTVTGTGSALNVSSFQLGTVGSTASLTITNGGTISGQTVSLVSGVATVDGANSTWNINDNASTFDISSGGLLNIRNGATVNALGGIKLAATASGDGTIEIGGATAGILNTPVVYGNTNSSGTSTLSFTHNQGNYFFTDDGTSGGLPINITGSTHVHVPYAVSSFGITTLMGTDTYADGTTVDWGTLRAGTAGALPNNTAFTVNGNNGLLLGGTLDLARIFHRWI